MTAEIERRKQDHLTINLQGDVQAIGVSSGYEKFRFVHNALPEINFDDIDCRVNYFGKLLRLPLMISCMTGGTSAAGRVNAVLAEVAETFGLALGLGSARILLEDEINLPSFSVRKLAPTVSLSANLGAVQLNCGVTVDDCKRLVGLLEADILVLHLNPLQEALQVDGDTCFGGLLRCISGVCAAVGVPVVAKEVGWGLSADNIHRLIDAGVSGVDIAGAGGTSWSRVEAQRSDSEWLARVGEQFAGWGTPTAEVLQQLAMSQVDVPVVASGGVTNGIEMAKAIALGADVVGIAGPFLRAARDFGAAADYVRELDRGLRCAMFATGVSRLSDLKFTPSLQPLETCNHQGRPS